MGVHYKEVVDLESNYTLGSSVIGLMSMRIRAEQTVSISDVYF